MLAVVSPKPSSWRRNSSEAIASPSSASNRRDGDEFGAATQEENFRLSKCFSMLALIFAECYSFARPSLTRKNPKPDSWFPSLRIRIWLGTLKIRGGTYEVSPAARSRGGQTHRRRGENQGRDHHSRHR